MIAQRKMLRVFQLLNIMSEGEARVCVICKRTGITERSVYRYFKLLEEIGFEVVNNKMRYSLGTGKVPNFIKLFQKQIGA